ncbi:stage V sporulation protein D (sporulation-specific penicillin-binding protein) [Desulfofundulus australicus DSM 11792]|uniref:Stage V sporulation protein D (Sporulation-specific penicillin-binding protein) n=1 Tax=Desulfofundulus australicus DSM 11792 TaxID=1121425 RepID=A0A1M5A3K6_9FIRM|nr:stage V sporulation protein D [Desulfofundulus australicus]SHF24873.1 stage V sporulation protein D (sporulation-specific penicillin-binding protein) [Desulfofundulus australicus DSM 11792]
MRATRIVIRRRLTLLFLLATAAFVALTGRLIWIQFVRADELQQKALEVRMRDIPVEARRGDIYDRNGQLLVTSVSTESLYAIPYLVKDPRRTAEQLASLLDMKEERLYQILSRKSCYEWVARKLKPETVEKIKGLNLPGLFFVEENVRYYEYDSLAAHVLGFTGIDNQGLTGIEKTFDRELQGTRGRIVVEQDATGREVPGALHKYIPPRQGNSLVLTLDRTIQQFVERELDRVVEKYNPKLAVIIVMDPRTGEILAMGNRPTFDLKNWMTAPQGVWDRNPAIWYNYEPGSTFKIITTSAAISEGVVKPDDQFFDPGYIKVADRYIRCWADGGHGSQTFEQVVMNSCNPGFVEVGLRLGKEKFYSYIKKFGFGEVTGIDLPGEASGIMIPQEKATNLNLATMAIGQSIAVTPIQLLTATCAVANGGVLLRPHLVKEIRDPEGNVLKTFQPEVVRRVLDQDKARQVAELLQAVVMKGTGRNAFIDGYRVAGKTGTAQVVGEGGGYVSGKYVASFTGFAPADNPRVAALVMVAEPQGGIYYGSQVAAPVFREVVRDTLHYLQVPETPGLEKPKDPFVYFDQPPVKVRVPNVVNYPLETAQNILREVGLSFVVRGEGSIVQAQMPKAGAEVLSGTSVVLDLQPPGGKSKEGLVTVPNLTGLTITQVATLLASMDLRLEAVGVGEAASQNPRPGERVRRGTVVRVEFKPGTSSLQAPPAIARPVREFVERP